MLSVFFPIGASGWYRNGLENNQAPGTEQKAHFLLSALSEEQKTVHPEAVLRFCSGHSGKPDHGEPVERHAQHEGLGDQHWSRKEEANVS